MEVRRVAQTLRDFFTEHDVPFAVVGGFGLHAYGLTRATFDLDLLTAAEAQAELVSFMEGLGYRTLHRSAGYSNHAHGDAAWGRVDFIYVRGDTARELFASLRSFELSPGLELPVPRPEHLAALKVHAMKSDPERRYQDMADLRFLLRLPGIDTAEMRAQFAKRGMLEIFHELKEDD